MIFASTNSLWGRVARSLNVGLDERSTWPLVCTQPLTEEEENALSVHLNSLPGCTAPAWEPSGELMQRKVMDLAHWCPSLPCECLSRDKHLSPPGSVDRPKSTEILICLAFQSPIRLLSLSWSPASYTYLHSYLFACRQMTLLLVLLWGTLALSFMLFRPEKSSLGQTAGQRRLSI